jgi:tyrosyl-tRNA synthetase
MAPIQEAYQASAEWQEICELAYPPPVVQKKVKKVKDKGSRFPGNLPVREQASKDIEPSDK